MDYFQTKINQWADWQAVRQSVPAFEALIKQIYLSENEPFKTPEPLQDERAAVFAVGATTIAILPPNTVIDDPRDWYQTERFSLTRMARLQLTAPQLQHAGFIFDAYQFYYLIYRPLAGVSLTTFAQTAEPLAKSTLGRQIGTVLNQVNGEVASFNQVNAVVASDQADWDQLGADFGAARQAFLQAHPTNHAAFVHGELTGDNLIVTSGQVGLRHFAAARQAPWQTELVPVLLQAFDRDQDFIEGFKVTNSSADLVTDLLLGLLWRADGPAQIRQVMGANVAVTMPTLTEQLKRILGEN